IAAQVTEVLGVDIDGEAVTTARAGNRRDSVSFLQADGVEYCRTHPGRFDVMVLCHVIEHLDDPRSLLQAAAAHTRGAYIEVPDFERSLLNRCRALAGSELIYSDGDHVWEFDRGELRQLIADCGLRVHEEEARDGVTRVWCTPGAPADPD